MRHPPPGFTLLQMMVVMLVLTVAAGLAVTFHTRLRPVRNEVHAAAMLKALVTYESVGRLTDFDRNGVADYWTRDVAGFHCVWDVNAKPVAFVDLALACADAAPGRAYPELSGVNQPDGGFRFQAMSTDQDGNSYIYAKYPAPTAKNAPAGVCTHPSRFGFTAFPAAYGRDGRRSFLVNEDGTVWEKDAGTAAPALHRAAAAPPGNDLTWTQWDGS